MGSSNEGLARAKAEGWAHWIRTPSDHRAVAEGCYFDTAAAERVRAFFNCFLKHSKGKNFAGKPFRLLPYQYNDIIAPIFGWKDRTGCRRFRTAYIEIPKKNGKSTLASGISLYLLVADGEPGAEVYSTAASRDQASIVYDEAANMADASTELADFLRVRRSVKIINFPATRSKYQAISADAETSQGKNAHGIVCDELHAWKGRDFFESLIWAGSARQQPLFLMITTAGDDLTSVCYEEHQRTERIAKGEEYAPDYYGKIWAADPTDDWLAESAWRKANPSLEETIPLKNFAADARQAQQTPARQNAFKRYRLNLWVGAGAAWISAGDWDACGAHYTAAEFFGGEVKPRVWGGLDLSRTRDLSALVWIKADNPDGDFGERMRFIAWPRIYMPEGLVHEKEAADKVPYSAWVRDGWITPTPGDVVDYETIRNDVLKDSETAEIAELAYDPYNAEYLCNNELAQQHAIETLAVTQSMANMGPPSTAFEAFVRQRRIIHPKNPCLDWMVRSAVTYTDTNDNIRPVKRRSRGRIDGLVALLLGLGRALPAAKPRRWHGEEDAPDFL